LPPSLHDHARDFAARLSDLLNRTVANGIRVSAVLARPHAVIGYNVTRQRPVHLEGIPLTISRAAPPCYLLVSHTLQLDPEGEYLTDQKSAVGVYLDGLPPARPIIRYEYERDPAHEYPAAHVQVHGESVNLAALCERRGVERALHRLHFPVGGRRFRPSVEDVVECLILEDLVEARDGWEEAIDEHRRGFYERQLRAAVRRNPDIAATELRALGWRVQAPEEE
jgi:hypothetical protein